MKFWFRSELRFLFREIFEFERDHIVSIQSQHCLHWFLMKKLYERTKQIDVYTLCRETFQKNSTKKHRHREKGGDMTPLSPSLSNMMHVCDTLTRGVGKPFNNSNYNAKTSALYSLVTKVDCLIFN